MPDTMLQLLNLLTKIFLALYIITTAKPIRTKRLSIYNRSLKKAKPYRMNVNAL